MIEPASIIIINHNGRKYLGNCISSVLSQSYQLFELIIFDNASSDGSIEFINENFSDKRIKVIRSESNLGFAKANNEAIKHCSNDLIILLNNDTETDRNWLKNLLEAMFEKNTIASSLVITEGIPEKYYETNGSVSYLMYNVMNVFDNDNQIFYPNGCSFVFRKSELGEPFDSDYFFYSEDLYLGLRARFSGMNIKFVKNSIVYHKGSGTPVKSEIRTFYQERNRFLNLYVFFSLGFIIRIIPYIFFNHNLKLLISLFDKKKSFIGLIKAYFWFYFNIPLILRKRKAVNKHKLIDENEIIKYITSKVFNGENIFERTVNKLSYYYSRMVGIKPLEYHLNNNIELISKAD